MVANIFDFSPLLDNFWAKFILAHFAKVLNLRLIRRALVAKVVKKDVNLEIIGQSFLVLANVFGT